MSIKTLNDYRRGAAGALMDEYERATNELKAVLQNISEANYARIADPETQNEDCRSVQTIINHVVRSGYAYANYAREQISMSVVPFGSEHITLIEAGGELDKMLAYTFEIFEGRWETAEDEIFELIIKNHWGPVYNIDQLFEHAIVHILKHRRQIEKFLLKFKAAPAS